MAKESRGDSPEPTSDQDEMRPNYSNRGYEQRRNSLPIQNKNKPPPFKKMMKKKKRSNAWSICSLTGLVIVLLIISAYLLVKYQKEIEAQVNKFQELNDTKMPSVISDEQTAVDEVQKITPKEQEKNTNTTINTDSDTDTDTNAHTIINTNANIKNNAPVENNSPDAQEEVPRQVNIELNNNEAETKKPKPPKKDPPKLPSDPTSAHLFQAINDNEVDMAEALIKAGVNLNDVKDGMNLLHYSASYLRVDIMRLILESGRIDIEAKATDEASFNSTALHIVATFAGSSETAEAVEAAKLLIEYGAIVDSLADQNLTPLCVAAMFSTNAALIQFLIEKGADPNHVENTYNFTPLHSAMVNCDVAVIKTLLNNNANPTALNSYLRQAIHEAAYHGCYHGVQHLLLKGISVDVLTPSNMPVGYKGSISYGSTPLHFAALKGHMKVVEHLLLCRASPTIYNRHGFSAANCADKNSFPEIADFIQLFRRQT